MKNISWGQVDVQLTKNYSGKDCMLLEREILCKDAFTREYGTFDEYIDAKLYCYDFKNYELILTAGASYCPVVAHKSKEMQDLRYNLLWALLNPNYKTEVNPKDLPQYKEDSLIIKNTENADESSVISPRPLDWVINYMFRLR